MFEVPCVLWQGFSDAFFPGRPGRRLHTEADFYLDTMANRPLTDDAGLTKHGAASMGLHYQKSEIYEEQAKRYAGEIKKISSMLAEDPANTTLLSQMQEYQDGYRRDTCRTGFQTGCLLRLRGCLAVSAALQRSLRCLSARHRRLPAFSAL